MHYLYNINFIQLINDITPTSNPSSIYSSQAQLIAKHDSISNFSENTYGAATDIDFPFVSATVKNYQKFIDFVQQLTASKFSISDLKQKSSLKHIEGVSNDKKANVQKSQEKIIQCDRFRKFEVQRILKTLYFQLSLCLHPIKFEFNDKENINLSQVDMNSFHHPQPLQIQIISPINSEQPLTLKIHPTQQNSDEKQIASKSQRNSKNSNKNNSRLSSQRRSQRNSVKSPKKEYQQTQNNGDFQKYESQNSLQLTTVEQREEEELRECTFKPQLNSNSLRLAQNNEKIESKAEKIAKLKIQRQINMKAIQEYREQLKIQENCTFKPQINQKSEKMVENRIKQIQECQNYDEQYLGHKRASRCLDDQEQFYHPKTNEIKESLISKDLENYLGQSVFQRLAHQSNNSDRNSFQKSRSRSRSNTRNDYIKRVQSGKNILYDSILNQSSKNLTSNQSISQLQTFRSNCQNLNTEIFEMNLENPSQLTPIKFTQQNEQHQHNLKLSHEKSIQTLNQKSSQLFDEPQKNSLDLRSQRSRQVIIPYSEYQKLRQAKSIHSYNYSISSSQCQALGTIQSYNQTQQLEQKNTHCQNHQNTQNLKPGTIFKKRTTEEKKPGCILKLNNSISPHKNIDKSQKQKPHFDCDKIENESNIMFMSELNFEQRQQATLDKKMKLQINVQNQSKNRVLDSQNSPSNISTMRTSRSKNSITFDYLVDYINI